MSARGQGTNKKTWKLSLKNRMGKKKVEKAEGTELFKNPEDINTKGYEEGKREEGSSKV